MAVQFTIGTSIYRNDGSQTLQLIVQGQTIAGVAATPYATQGSDVLTTGGTAQALNFGTVPVGAARVAIVNLDPVNSIDISTATGGSFAGSKFASIPANDVFHACITGQIYLKSSASAVPFDYIVCTI
jgi:hypothetical protein